VARGVRFGETTMVPKLFLKNVTDEDRRFLRKWTIGVAVAYGIAALALLLINIVAPNGQRTIEASRAAPPNHTAEPVSAWRSNGGR
jgi:hypothetical protein